MTKRWIKRKKTFSVNGDYPWYEVVDGLPVTQGDLLRECPIIRPIYSDALLPSIGDDITTETAITYSDCIVMTQACDLEYEKVSEIILCPFQSVTQFQEDFPSYSMKKIVRGDIPALVLLSEHTGQPILEASIVSFREIFSIPRGFVEQFAANLGKRLRLLPPYREHLSQSFARYFMRVGLPQEVSGLTPSPFL